MSEKERALKEFLFERMYRHNAVVKETDRARGVVTDLFAKFIGEPDTLPEQWREDADSPNTARTARVVCDYIAGMTDQFALRQYRQFSERKH
jgi:dGTPase